jgi:hypothetical protein
MNILFIFRKFKKMLKIEAIKSTWNTLSQENQISLLNELKFQTLGLSQKTILDNHPSKHIFEICGALSFNEYKIILEKYEKLMERIISGKVIIGYYNKIFVNMSSKIVGNFEITHSKTIDWNEYTEVLTKEKFLKYYYNNHISSIHIDDIPLALAQCFKQ